MALEGDDGDDDATAAIAAACQQSEAAEEPHEGDAAGDDATKPDSTIAGETANGGSPSVESGVEEQQVPSEPAKPLSWAERAALQAESQASASSSSTGLPKVAYIEDVKVPNDSFIDYLILLAERRRQSDAGANIAVDEIPEPLRKFSGCFDVDVAVTARSSYTRLGLMNTANNCYVSVVVHSLLQCNALLWVLRRCPVEDPRRPIFSCLVTLCKEFHTRKPSANGDLLNMLAISQVKNVVASWQRLGAQQDAGEFLFYLLGLLHDECKWKVHVPSSTPDGGAGEEQGAEEAGEEQVASAWAHVVRTHKRACETRSAGLHEDSPITRIFGGLLESSVRSQGAKVDSVSLEPFNHLDLDISAQTVTSVRTALEAFCSAEAVNDGRAMRRINFKITPKVLILSLKRFMFAKGKGGTQKIKKAIRYDEKLVLDKSWLPVGVASPEYFLTALICHHGDHAARGHYSAIVRYNADWYFYDDNVVRQVPHREVAVQQQTAYVLFYQTRDCVNLAP